MRQLGFEGATTRDAVSLDRLATLVLDNAGAITLLNHAGQRDLSRRVRPSARKPGRVLEAVEVEAEAETEV